MKKNKILESFQATRGIQEDENLDLILVPEEPEEEEVMNVVDGDLQAGEDGDNQSYVGRYVAICPVCAEPFFCNAEASIIEGICHDVCPVCQEEVDAQVIGVVSPIEEETPENDEVSEDGEPSTKDDKEVPPVEEGTKSEDLEDKVKEGVDPTPDTHVCEKCGKDPCECKEESTTPKFSLEFDESAMNSLLSQFAKENYPTMKSIAVERVVRRPGQLVIEAKYVTAKGNERVAHFVAENFRVGRRMKIETACRELGAPAKGICIEARLKGGAIIPESMTYDYVTRILHEGKVKKAQISGSHKV